MDGLVRFGRIVFAVAMMCFGALFMIYASWVGIVKPGPPWSTGYRWIAWIVAIAFFAVGVCFVLQWKGRTAATLLGVALLWRALSAYLLGMLGHLRDPSRWTSGFELVALGGAALVLATNLPPDREGSAGALDKFFAMGRYLFALALVVFGVQHFLYAGFIATLIPAWIPGKLFWAYFVGVAFFAAALSIATGKMARLASTLLGVMFLAWVVILHMPRVAAAPHNGNEWTSEFIALAMGGASFLMISAVSRDKAALTRA